MYGLDKKISLSFLEDRELAQVCIGKYQIILNFDKDVSISVECFLKLIDKNGFEKKSKIFPESATQLIPLLGSQIKSVKNLGKGNLEIKFSEGSVLKIFDGNKNAESYQISAPGVDLIV